MKANSIALILFLFLSVAGCNRSNYQFDYHVPERRSDGLKVAAMHAVGIDTARAIEAVNRIGKGKYGEIHAVVLYTNGKLVLEEYFKGHEYQWDGPGHRGPPIVWNADKPHALQSVTKSFMSICIGIAVDKGFIKSVEQSIFEYLPEYEKYNTDNKAYVTIEHLLTMRSGFQWDEWHAPLSSTRNDAIGMYFAGVNPVEFVLQRPLVAVPGTRFNYSGGDIELLSAILKNATGMDIEDFSATYLFDPMGIKSYDWWLRYPSGEVSTAGGLKLIPRDMLKIGVLFLNKGVWNGQRLLSEEWVVKSGYPFGGNTDIEIPGEDLGNVGYGYTWWTRPHNEYGRMFCALGWGGQKIMVFPDLNTVIAFTGANYTSRVKHNRILERYLLPAVK